MEVKNDDWKRLLEEFFCRKMADYLTKRGWGGSADMAKNGGFSSFEENLVHGCVLFTVESEGTHRLLTLWEDRMFGKDLVLA